MMDFGIRELLMLVGVLVFFVVALDGIRRFQHNRKTQLKVHVDRKANAELANEYDDEDLTSPELPNGGARIKNGGSSQKVAPTFSEPLDILMAPKTVEVNTEPDDFQHEETETEVSIKAEVVSAPQETVEEQEAVNEPEQNEKEILPAETKPKPQGDLFNSSSGDEEEPKLNLQETKPDLPEVVLAINVIAKGEEEFSGQALMEAVLSFGLRFGDMNIFHRHENSNGQGAVIFSMANALNPGTFDLKTLPEENIKGVTFFMRLSQVNKRVFVLELMLDIAKRLANQLNAELRDETHSVLSSQTVSHYKSKIQEYERQHLGQVLRGRGD